MRVMKTGNQKPFHMKNVTTAQEVIPTFELLIVLSELNISLQLLPLYHQVSSVTLFLRY